jgi:hypothetical protein
LWALLRTHKEPSRRNIGMLILFLFILATAHRLVVMSQETYSHNLRHSPISHRRSPYHCLWDPRRVPSWCPH